jgi:hypothetical protein
MTSRLRNLYQEGIEEELSKSSPISWMVQSYMFSPEDAITFPNERPGRPRFGDINAVWYDNNGDIIYGVNDGSTNTSQWPSFVAKVRRPKSGIVGGEVEWKWFPPDGGVGDVTRTYHSRALQQTLVLYKSKFYILDDGGNLLTTVTPSSIGHPWNAHQPNAIFYNDKQILYASWQGQLTIYNISDGSIAWSISPTAPANSGFGPITVWSNIYNNDTRVIYFLYKYNYIQKISFSVTDQYVLPPTNPSISTAYYAPSPGAMTTYRGGRHMLLDSNDSNIALPYLHFNLDDVPEMSIPFVNSNNVDVHPYLFRGIFTHALSIYELDLNRALTSSPFKHSFSNMYVGQPSTTASTLAWTYTKNLKSIYLHFYNNMNVNASISIYFMYPYSTTSGTALNGNSLLNTLTPPPTPAQTLTVNAGTSTDVSITDPPMAILIQGASASSPSSGNLVISAEGEV